MMKELVPIVCTATSAVVVTAKARSLQSCSVFRQTCLYGGRNRLQLAV